MVDGGIRLLQRARDRVAADAPVVAVERALAQAQEKLRVNRGDGGGEELLHQLHALPAPLQAAPRHAVGAPLLRGDRAVERGDADDRLASASEQGIVRIGRRVADRVRSAVKAQVIGATLLHFHLDDLLCRCYDIRVRTVPSGLTQRVQIRCFEIASLPGRTGVRGKMPERASFSLRCGRVPRGHFPQQAMRTAGRRRHRRQ